MAKTPQTAHRRHGPRCRGARANPPACSSPWPQAAEHVHDDIVLAAADDEPAAALEWRKTYMPPEVKEWTGSWQRVSASQSERCQTSSRPSMLTCQPQVVGHDDSRVPWPSKLPGTIGCPCLGWCRVARLQTFFHFSLVLGIRHSPVTVVLMNGHLETLGVHCHFSPFAAASSTSTRTCCKMLPPLERARWPHNPMNLPHARVYRACQQGSAGQNLQGRVREGVAGSQTTAPKTLPASARASQACAAFSRDGPTTRCRRSRRCTTTQQHGPTSSAPLPSGQTSSLLPHRATSQARCSCITAVVWRRSFAPSWQRTHPCLTPVRDARA